METDKYIALDTETQEFNKSKGITPRKAKMEGLAVAYSEDLAEYETDPELWPSKMPKDDTTAVFHHARFDLMKFKQNGLPVPKKWEDTLIAAHLVDENSSHGLKDLARGLRQQKLAEAFGGDTVVDYKDVDRNDPVAFAEYAKDDAKNTLKLWLQRFKKELSQQELIAAYELEKSIVPVAHQMQETGLLIDQAELASFAVGVKEEREEKKQAVFELAGEEFKIDSPKAVGEFLYDKVGLKCLKTSKKTGARSTDKEALIALEHPLSDAILSYREVSKLETAFINRLPDHIDEDGRIHPDFNPLGPVTGRFACSDPNVQQAPSKGKLGKQLRRCFVAEKGKKLVVADYSQAELRILAHFSNDPILVAAYTKGNIDLHEVTGKSIFGKETLSKAERDVAKIINFGIVYGLSAKGLHRRLPALGIKGFSLQDCARFIQKYFQTYKGVESFLGRVERRIKRVGYVKSVSGRRRHLPLGDHREIRQGQNFIIQGTSADLCKTALVGIYSQLPSADCKIIGMVHDEILVEAPEEEALLVKELAEQWISQVPDNFRVPMTTTAHIVDRWSEAK